MKLLRVGEKGKEKPATLDKNSKIRDLSSHIKDFNSDNLKLEKVSKLKNINLDTLPEIKSSERIGACINKPGKFVAIGLNYSDHAKETGATPPSEPIVFMKATSSISGPYDDIEMPKDSSKLDWEVELGIVIGKETKNISEKEASNHILGYCIVNDVSEREWQLEKSGQWVKGKSGDTFGPTGPYLVTQDEIPDINNLNLILEVNGKKMQSGNTNSMIFNVNFLISYLSKFMSLQPGDLITTGTPAGVGMGMKPQVFLKSGDNIKLGIDFLGEQNSKVVIK
ncbi:fumarylacetoacetate hydrolase family protein [Candidatus Pelagibacter sp.]|nr:fumarylacetoacetate hydrolase family protein [Candidatus Pelagibacter sp.]